MSSIREAVDLLFQPGQVIEVRAISDEGMASGYFDNPESLVQKVGVLAGEARFQGVYVTLNEVNPALLARRANRVKLRLGKKDAATADSDILYRHWLPIDIDPIRPSGVSSSDKEHDAALAKAGIISSYLAEMGWPDPVIGDSGNGAHLLYRIDLPNDEASRDLVKGCLEALDTRFSDERCKVDTANFNAARIWKLYGTISRKGDNTPERPHRPARIISAPEKAGLVEAPDLETLARLFPREPPKQKTQVRRRQGEAIDISSWLSEHGLGFTEKPYQGGSLFILDECPFSGAHADGAYVIQFSSGAIFAGCHHDSCGHGTQRWSELREQYEGKRKNAGERLKQLRSDRIRAKAEAEGHMPPDREDEELITEAASILREHDPLRFLLDTFSLDHEGDRVVGECLVMSLASRSVINSKGLHVSITGESGKGKSHTIDTMLAQVPDELRLDGRMSDKALFYIEGLRAGSVIALDDVSLSDQMQEILKGVTTSFQRPFQYRTVSKDRTGQVCTIPERCVWWVAKVEGMGDDQVFNRMLTCWIDDSEEQDARVLVRTLQEAEQRPETRPQTRRENLIAQEMWRSIRTVWVLIPYARRIRFQTAENRRNPDMLLDLIKANAVLRQHQREKEEIDQMVCVIAAENDFYEAARLFEALNGETGGQATKLTKKEAQLIEAIRELRQDEFTISQLQRVTGWANATISKLLNGYNSRGQAYSGLLEKCPAISFLDRTVTTGEEGHSTQRRSKVFTWDPYLYDIWAKGGSVWLEGSGEDRDGTEGGGNPPAGGAGSRPHLPQVSAGAENEPGPLESQKEKETKNYSYCTSGAGEGEGMKQPDPAGVCTRDDDCGCSSAETRGVIPPPRPPSPVPAEDSERIVPAQTGDLQNMRSPAAGDRDVHPPISAINPAEFRPVDGWPEKEPCIVCRRRSTTYREKSQKKRPGEKPEPPRMLCSSCFRQARQRTSSTFRMIPGLVDVNRMVKITYPAGRCQVCNTQVASYSDPESRIQICETCYQREKVPVREVILV